MQRPSARLRHAVARRASPAHPRGARGGIPCATGLAAALLLCACTPTFTDTGSYFPLQAGHRWHYDVKTEWENNIVEHEARVMTTLGQDAIENGEAWRRRSDSGVDYWLRSDDSGIFRVASKSDLQAEPAMDSAKRYVLRSPFAVGTSWQTNTTAYLLHRRQEFPREIRHSHPSFPMIYTIEAVGQRHDTRAGRFDDCLRVRGVAVLRLYADPVVGWRDLPITTVEWYCKGVGLVRVTRDEPALSTFLGGGTMTMELTRWQ